MRALMYDGSFQGWLTVLFKSYEYKWGDIMSISALKKQESLFGETHFVDTDELKSARVWKGIQQKGGGAAANLLYRAFLSELEGAEIKLFHYARYVLEHGKAVTADFSNPFVLFVCETARKVHREKHRMEAFVRFQKTKDQLYYALIEPDFNVLPLILEHFEKRYADQQWMIYDVKRKYGLYYNLENTSYVTVNFSEQQGTDAAALLDETELLYQELWKNYFSNVNIKARKNLKLHIQHMPKRYWKYLIEKSEPAGGS